MQERIVEAEQRDDPVAAIDGQAQGRLVAEAQIAPQPDDRGAHCVHDNLNGMLKFIQRPS
jgi:hypothetical protein